MTLVYCVHCAFGFRYRRPSCSLVPGVSCAQMVGGMIAQVPGCSTFTFCVVEHAAASAAITRPAAARLTCRLHSVDFMRVPPVIHAPARWWPVRRSDLAICFEVRKSLRIFRHPETAGMRAATRRAAWRRPSRPVSARVAHLHRGPGASRNRAHHKLRWIAISPISVALCPTLCPAGATRQPLSSHRAANSPLGRAAYVRG